MLVAQLAFDAHAQRRAVADRQRFAVEAVRDDRLRVVGIDEVDAFVIVLSIEIVGTAEEDEASILLQPGLVEQQGELRTRPFADRAPTFHAVVPRDLRALGQAPDVVEAQAQRFMHQSAHLEPPIGKTFRGMARVVAVLRVGRSIAAEEGGNRAARILGRQRSAIGQQAMGTLVPFFGRTEQRFAAFAFGHAIAACEKSGTCCGQEVATLHGRLPPVSIARTCPMGPDSSTRMR